MSNKRGKVLLVGFGAAALAIGSGAQQRAGALGREGGAPPCNVGAQVQLGTTTIAGFPQPGQTVTLASTALSVVGQRNVNPPGIAGGSNCGAFDVPTTQFSWAIVSRPSGSSASLTGATSLSPRLAIDEAGDYTVRLTACSNGCSVPSLYPSLYHPTVAPEAHRDVTVHAVAPRDLLVDAFNQLKPGLISKYGLDSSATLDASALPLLVNQPLLTYAAPHGSHGPISLEVHAQAPTVWVGVTHPSGRASLWFEMQRGDNGQFTPRVQPAVLSTPFPTWGQVTNITDTFKFTNNGEYGVFHSSPGLGPTPHWLPIFTQDPPPGAMDDGVDLDRTLHAAVWANAGQGMAIVNSYLPTPSFNNLRDRAQEAWWTTTVRGMVAPGAGISGNDFAYDHSIGFAEDHDSIYNHGECCGSYSDPTWPGMDWDAQINADPDSNYTSTENNTGVVEMETEHFMLAPAYRPQGGDWLQAAGRLVLDDGHPSTDSAGNDHYHSEIHPAELLVSSEPKGALGVVARVIATGDWLGGPLSFVVNPPPRPTPTATLSFVMHRADGTINQFDQKLNADLTLTPTPPDAPTYILGTIVSTGGNGVEAYDSGQIAPTKTRGLQVFVEATWNEPSTMLSAKLLSGPTTPAAGAHLFYRRAATTDSMWQRADADGQGRVQLDSLLPEAYYFRPGGSGVGFTGVPQLVALKPGQNNLVFGGGLVAPPGNPGVIRVQSVTVSLPWTDRVAASGFTIGGAVASADPLAAAAFDAYTQKLFGVDENTGTSGVVAVVNNGLGVPAQVPVLIHLASAVDSNGHPIPSLAASYRQPATGPNGSQFYPGAGVPGYDPFLAGLQGPGVAGATLHVRLVLGNAQAGYRTIADLSNVTTDAHGVAGVLIAAGTHVEDAVLEVDVTSNPVNTWFTPSIRATPLLFYPAKTGDDSIAQSPYTLTVLPTLAVSPHYPDFIGEIEEVEEVDGAARTLRARGTAQPLIAGKIVAFPQLSASELQRLHVGGILLLP